MSLPQFREGVLRRIDGYIAEYTTHLVEQTSADHDQMRLIQGRISAAVQIKDLINEEFRRNYG